MGSVLENSLNNYKTQLKTNVDTWASSGGVQQGICAASPCSNIATETTVLDGTSRSVQVTVTMDSVPWVLFLFSVHFYLSGIFDTIQFTGDPIYGDVYLVCCREARLKIYNVLHGKLTTAPISQSTNFIFYLIYLIVLGSCHSFRTYWLLRYMRYENYPQYIILMLSNFINQGMQSKMSGQQKNRMWEYKISYILFCNTTQTMENFWLAQVSAKQSRACIH